MLREHNRVQVAAPSVLLDPALSEILDDICLLLGRDAAALITPPVAPEEGKQVVLDARIVHLFCGSEIWQSVEEGRLQLAEPNETSGQPILILHHRDEASARVIDRSRYKNHCVAEIIGLPWTTTDADVDFAGVEQHCSAPWERAAGLGHLYLGASNDLELNREIAGALAAVDVGMRSARLAPLRNASGATRRLPTQIGTAMLGIPAATVSPNESYSRPYLADRAGLCLTVRPNGYLQEQPVSFWPYVEGHVSGRTVLPPQLPLDANERLTVLDARVFDLAVGAPMILVRREATSADGFITLDALVSKTEGEERELWASEQPRILRGLVEFHCAAGTLYSTNRAGPNEVRDSIEFLARFSDQSDDLKTDPIHPLQVGAHAHRLGTWALDDNRSPTLRYEVTRIFAGMLERYAGPNAVEVAPGAIAWPYTFDFRMPWATKLTPPWFSGYANAAMAGALAIGATLTGEARWKDLARGAVGYLTLPTRLGGALYVVDGFEFVTEYCYRTPPIPNYRVLDGEIGVPQFLHNAALLLDDPEILAFAVRLAAGLTVSLKLLRHPDRAPLFGMDGQNMNPNYMWQLWMSLQLLAAITKDRNFAHIARDWARMIPETFWQQGFPR